VIFSLQISIGLLLDFLCGDPKWLYHPVRAIGTLCCIFESLTRKFMAPLGMRFCGILTFFLVLGTSVSILFVLFYLLVAVSNFLTALVSVMLLYMSFAAGDLLAHSKQVYSSLSSSDISQARSDVALIVGRETDHLDETEISRACVESVAENLVDGITAPLFWAVLAAILLGEIYFEPIVWAVAGAYFYKSVNTMDSMFGYKNERYREFGWMAARFDDLVNYIPARLSALCIVFAASILHLDYKNSAKVLFRDRLKNSSPNSGYPEAAVSGALNIQLGGAAIYFGEKTEGQLIGAGQRGALPGDIKNVNKLALTTSIIFFAALLLLYNLSVMI
jgi:adenosylcobinamide-phosphate synthase